MRSNALESKEGNVFISLPFHLFALIPVCRVLGSHSLPFIVVVDGIRLFPADITLPWLCVHRFVTQLALLPHLH